jgi:hypothetical protein
LTPVQIGAGVGAALTVLILFAIRDLSPRGPANSSSNFLIGVLGGVGAILGMGVASLVTYLRHRKSRDGAVGEPTAAAAPAVVVPDGPAEPNGSPALRVAAGLFAVLLAVAWVLMMAQGNKSGDGGILMAALALLFGWYAARGNKGLPQFLTRK